MDVKEQAKEKAKEQTSEIVGGALEAASDIFEITAEIMSSCVKATGEAICNNIGDIFS